MPPDGVIPAGRRHGAASESAAGGQGPRDAACAELPAMAQGRFFNAPSDDGPPPPVRLGWRYLWEYLWDGRTPIRAISDEAIRRALRYLYGPGRIIELGAPSEYYRRFAPPEQAYTITDCCEHAAERIDMTQLPYGDQSIDAFVSIFSLEHIYDYARALSEVERALKRGGRFLLVMPFLYYYHAAPDDYVRLTKSALLRLLSNFRILSVQSLGCRALFVAEMYHEKREMGHPSSWLRRLVLRLLGAPFVAAYLLRPAGEDAYASAYLLLCEKS